ncbi:7-carboxy-7-deazaguanine synthase QueE, partial [Alkalibacillus haloalkaliphilus]|uniref:7-carboxy-7-deazaguanine synthase QueE n=1 Tax=Alkalibacillus haloalkaliphilus TaxID=94136 RepID=UPI0003031BEF
MTAEEVWRRLKAIGGDRFNHVTISGGNPALLKNLNELISLLKQNEIEVALETQGSRWQDWFTQIDDLTISPKPPSSNMNTDFAILDRIIHNLTELNRLEQTSLKVVIFDEADYQYAKGVKERYPQIPLYLQVGNRDVHGEDIDNLTSTLLNQYEQLIDRVVQDDELNNVRVLPQLHTLVWGNKRGV